MDLSKIINDLNNLISREYSYFRGSYLYGSRINGNYKDDSDIDVIMVFDRELENKEELKLAGIIGDVEYKNNVFIDYHPMTIDELSLNPPFYDEVVVKGVYYGAG